jgi:Secretion system C-terminal sorting domain
MKQITIIVLLSCLCMYHVRGQTLSPTLIGSAGAHASLFSFGTLDWSVGEVVTARFENGEVLTQGFHQVFVTVTSTSDEVLTPDNIKILVYPNPTMQWLNVSSTTPAKVRMVNLLGIEVKSFGSSLDLHQLDLSNLPSGLYVLEAVLEGEARPRTFKVEIVR